MTRDPDLVDQMPTVVDGQTKTVTRKEGVLVTGVGYTVNDLDAMVVAMLPNGREQYLSMDPSTTA